MLNETEYKEERGITPVLARRLYEVSLSVHFVKLEMSCQAVTLIAINEKRKKKEWKNRWK